MSKEVEKFLHAEQSAQDLLDTLEELKNETISYKTSANELNAVREKLSELIDSFLPITQGTREVLSVLKSIHPEVIDKISAVSVQITELSNEVVSALRSTHSEVVDKISTISVQVTEQSKAIRLEFEQKVKVLSDQLNRLRLLAIISLSIAGLSAIGIVVLLLR